MTDKLKALFLYCCKFIGLFVLSKWLYKNQLRILCYHNFDDVDGDVSQWRPGLVMKPHTFKKRLQFLANNNYSVLPLSDAIQNLADNKLPASSTVITIDDGWAATKYIAHKLLTERKFPYTVYITSYYSQKETPVFNVLIPYIFWKSPKKNIRIKDDIISIKGLVSLKDKPCVETIVSEIIEYGHSNLTYHERVELTKKWCEKLDVDYGNIEESRVFNLLTSEEIKSMAQSGVDIQLHSHRHRWPCDEKDALRELEENKQYLEPIVGRTLTHFCYPSGLWSVEQLPFLKKACIKSATTCASGLNTYQTNIQTLKRFLDGEDKSQIEFEAEICGFKTLLKKIGFLNR